MKRSWQLAMGLILIVAGPAAAQVSRIQNGRALDSNYLIGARGYNSIRRANRALDGNLLVTGQVAGGYHFRGDVGYVGSDQFRGELPSAGLDNFIRGSAGLDRLTSGGSYGPGAYYSSQRTVLGASRISKGLNAPGSSMPLRTYVPPAQYRQLEEQTLRMSPSRPVWTAIRAIRASTWRWRPVSRVECRCCRPPRPRRRARRDRQ